MRPLGEELAQRVEVAPDGDGFQPRASGHVENAFEALAVEDGYRLVERDAADLAEAARAADRAPDRLLARLLRPHPLDRGELRVGFQYHLYRRCHFHLNSFCR